MKVFVTGGGGFIGSVICRMLAARDDRVVAFQRSPAPALEGDRIEVHRGDITDADSVLQAMQGCDAVIHTAALAKMWGPARDFDRINVAGTDNVLEACRAWGIGTLVFTSSPSVVHAGTDIQDANEFLPYPDHFLAHYPRTKAESEHRVLEADGDNLRTCAIRPHLVWGPADPHFLPRLAEKAAAGPIKLPGPEKRVDTTYVDNAAHAHLLALDELANGARCGGKPYFVSDDQPLPQGDFIVAMLAAAGHRATVKPIPKWLAKTAGWGCEWAWKIGRRDGEPPVSRFVASQLCTHHWFDISAAKEDFGYRAIVPIREGLKRLREWVGRKRVTPDGNG